MHALCINWKGRLGYHIHRLGQSIKSRVQQAVLSTISVSASADLARQEPPWTPGLGPWRVFGHGLLGAESNLFKDLMTQLDSEFLEYDTAVLTTESHRETLFLAFSLADAHQRGLQLRSLPSA